MAAMGRHSKHKSKSQWSQRQISVPQGMVFHLNELVGQRLEKILIATEDSEGAAQLSHAASVEAASGGGGEEEDESPAPA